MLRILLTFIPLLMLAACTNLAPVVAAARADAQHAADASMDAALFAVCYPQTVGAWQREFGADAARAAAWRDLCGFRAALPAVKGD